MLVMDTFPLFNNSYNKAYVFQIIKLYSKIFPQMGICEKGLCVLLVSSAFPLESSYVIFAQSLSFS